MQTSAHYAEQIAEVARQLQGQAAAIRADGVITYDEITETQDVARDLAKRLSALKSEIRLETRQLTNDHKVRIANAQYTDRDELRRERANALAPYERLLLHLDEVMLSVSNVKDSLGTLLHDLQVDVSADGEQPPTQTQPLSGGGEQDARGEVSSSAPAPGIEDDGEYIDLDSVRRLHTRWIALLASLEKNLAAPQPDEIRQQLGGARNALKMALTGLEELLS